MGKGPDWLESLLMTIHSSGEKFKTLESVKNNSQVEYANGEMLLKQRELKEKLYCIFFRLSPFSPVGGARKLFKNSRP